MHNKQTDDSPQTDSLRDFQDNIERVIETSTGNDYDDRSQGQEERTRD